jgi:cell division septation protein DedD
MKTSMKIRTMKLGTLAAALLSGVLLFDAQAVNAQTNTPAATATRPAKTTPDQNSIPSSGPPATTTQTTGEASRDPTIKQMNEDEKSKVDTKGK